MIVDTRPTEPKDGSTDAKAILPKHVPSLLESAGIFPNPPGQPGFWIRSFMNQMAADVRRMRAMRVGVPNEK